MKEDLLALADCQEVEGDVGCRNFEMNVDDILHSRRYRDKYIKAIHEIVISVLTFFKYLFIYLYSQLHYISLYSPRIIIFSYRDHG